MKILNKIKTSFAEKREGDSQWKRARQNRSIGGSIVMIIVILLLGIVMLIPFYLAVINSLKPMDELFLFPPSFVVRRPTFQSYTTLSALMRSGYVPFSRYFFNTILVAVATTVGNVIVGSLAAYPFAKINFPGKKIMWNIIMLALVFQGGVAMAFAQYLIMASVGIVDTYWVVILPPVASTFSIFLMKQFMGEIHDDMIASARIDGANEWKVFWRIVMPMVKPAYLTLAIFAFQGAWQTRTDFIYTEEYKLLTNALDQLASISQAGQSIARQGAAAAATVLMIIPPTAFFVMTQSNVIQTMSHSGIKG